VSYEECAEPTLLPLADPDLFELQHTISWGAMSPQYAPHPSTGA
jgi:hypothetical protein